MSELSTFDQLKTKGLSHGDIVRAPMHKGQTLARLRRPYFTYAMVEYADGSQIGYEPRLLSKATDDEAATYKADAKRHDAEWEVSP